jgi:peptide deformylase
MIITEESKIRILCEEVKTIKEGEEIGAQLLKELAESKNGIGLAANQIGINKRVCVVNVKEPLVLINPRIVERSEEQFRFAEGCLSFPGKHVKTGRHTSVTVEADNHEGKMVFTADSKDINDAFECACVQHEIDHLDGITMFERAMVAQPYKAPKTPGRNEKVTITDGNETKELKWKKAQPLVESGDWEMAYPAGSV